MITKSPINKRALIIFITVGLLIVGFPIQAMAGEPFNCGDGPRYKIDVKEFVIKYSGKSFEGALGFLSRLKLGLKVEEKTLQKAAESTQQWNQLLIGLAEGYNSCAITKKQYQEAIRTLYPGLQADVQKMLDIGKALEAWRQPNLKELKRVMDEYFQKLKKFAHISGKEEIIEKISDKVEQEHERTRESIARTDMKLDLVLAKLEKSQEKDKIIAELRHKLQETERELQKRGASEALAQFEQGNYEEAERLFQEELQEKKAESASAAYYLGNIKFAELDFRASAVYYEEASQLDPNNTDYLNMAGRTLDILGKHIEAITYYEQALAIDRKVYGEEHPKVAIRLNNLGASSHSLGEYKKAMDYYGSAKDIFLKKLGDSHPYTRAVVELLKAAEGKIASGKRK